MFSFLLYAFLRRRRFVFSCLLIPQSYQIYDLKLSSLNLQQATSKLVNLIYALLTSDKFHLIDLILTFE
jgi:hypothetical protein